MFFSVKVPMKIDGKSYHTCVCYPLTETIKTTVEGLAKEEKVVLHEAKVFFCNGKVLEKKEVEVKPAVKQKKNKKEVVDYTFNDIGSLKDEREF